MSRIFLICARTFSSAATGSIQISGPATTAFKISGAQAQLDRCRVKNTNWENYDFPNQTRFNGWQFDGVTTHFDSREEAVAYAEQNKTTELEYYDIVCAPTNGAIP